MKAGALFIPIRQVARPSVGSCIVGISTDPDYTVSGVTRFYRQNNVLPGTPSFNEIHGYEIEPILQRVKNTAPGCDNLPAWLFKNALSSWLTW